MDNLYISYLVLKCSNRPLPNQKLLVKQDFIKTLKIPLKFHKYYHLYVLANKNIKEIILNKNGKKDEARKFNDVIWL